MLGATGRHPWRPAHIHMIVRAPGYKTVTTHIFDATQRVPRLRHRVRGQAVADACVRGALSADDPERPDGIPEGDWVSLENDIVLAPGDGGEPVDPGRTA